MLQYLYSDKVEEKIELIKGITLGNKDQFQLTPLLQVLTFSDRNTSSIHYGLRSSFLPNLYSLSISGGSCYMG
jgi:hypothetical protein